MRNGWAIAVFLVGCGRLGFDGQPEPGANMILGVDINSPLAPAQCESANGLATTTSTAIDLAVATTPTGASVFWAPTAGGTLRGIDVGLDRQASAVTMVIAGTYSETTAAYLDGRLVVGGLSGSRLVANDVPQPIAVGTELGNFGGDHVAKTAVVHVGTDRVMATSCTDMRFNSFDPTTWSGTEGTYTYNTPQTSHVAISTVGSRALSIIATASECRYFVGTNRSTSTTRTSPVLCPEGRLASDDLDQIAMVFEGGGSVQLVIDGIDTVTAANAMPIAMGSAPRVMRFDNRYWVTYLDDTNHIVIGFIDDQGMLLTRTLADVTTAKGYELTMFDGAPWVFAVDANTSTVVGHGLCAQ